MLDKAMNSLEMLFSLFSRHYHPKFPGRMFCLSWWQNFREWLTESVTEDYTQGENAAQSFVCWILLISFYIFLLILTANINYNL